MNDSPQRAVANLASRVLGEDAAALLSVEIEPAARRGYDYEWVSGRLELRATDAISACVGLRAYLRHERGRDVHWATRVPLGLNLTECEPGSGRARVEDQYMYNFCTYSYSTAHWTWSDWERELDWMALHGITMPLALVGHEAVLAEAWRRLGVDARDVLAFLGDPVYAPFQFMGCLDGDQPVMTPMWLDERRALGRRILDRSRELGMRPILPAFTGHVPPGWADEAARERDWQGNTTRFLDPRDDRFRQVAATIAEVQLEYFGTATHFAADPFIEMVPVDDGTDFPALVGRRILDGLGDVVPDAVWVMQAWPFSYQREYWSDERIAAFLDGVDTDRLLVLDLWAEADPIWPIADGFRGKDWHWCGLLNFGGRSDAVACLPDAVTEFERALASARPPSGLGLSMESFHHNAVFFELLCDLAWGAVDLETWFTGFATQRYGVDDSRAGDAWRRLGATLYDARDERIFPEDFHGILTKRADLVAATEARAFRARATSMMWFEPGALLDAWDQLTALLEKLPELGAGPLGIDLVEIAQAAGVRIVDERAVRVLEATGPQTRQAETDAMLAAIDSLDTVLSMRPESRLATAEAAAAAAATGGVDAARLITAQRRILTSWNALPGTELDDYSGRIWHGLVGGYYRPRLEAWARSVAAAAEGDDGAATRFSVELDDLWGEFMAAGVDEHPRSHADLGAATRDLQRHYAAAFGLDAPSARPASAR